MPPLRTVRCDCSPDPVDTHEAANQFLGWARTVGPPPIVHGYSKSMEPTSDGEIRTTWVQARRRRLDGIYSDYREQRLPASTKEP